MIIILEYGVQGILVVEIEEIWVKRSKNDLVQIVQIADFRPKVYNDSQYQYKFNSCSYSPKWDWIKRRFTIQDKKRHELLCKSHDSFWATVASISGSFRASSTIGRISIESAEYLELLHNGQEYVAVDSKKVSPLKRSLKLGSQPLLCRSIVSAFSNHIITLFLVES